MINRNAFRAALFLMGALCVAAITDAIRPNVGNAAPHTDSFEANDSHLHLVNFTQEGTNIHDIVAMMGANVGRAAVSGVPLQASARSSYDSFTDASVAMAYRALTATEQARLDPMISGFNPTDPSAVDHVRRVLTTFPGVFSGIGEVTIHKQFVSGEVAGETASLTDHVLDRLLDFAGEAGLVVLMRDDDIDAPSQLRDLYLHHPNTTIVWAHMGFGHLPPPVREHIAFVERLLSSRSLPNLYIDLSSDETAKYVVANPETLAMTADVINRHPDRFLFGTDEAVPADRNAYLKVYRLYAPLFSRLTPSASEQVRKGNYLRIFDEARRTVRFWEHANIKDDAR